MRARRESRFWAEAGAARRTVKIRTWQTRDIGLRSQDRGKFSKVTAQNGTCEALAPAGIVWQVSWTHSISQEMVHVASSFSVARLHRPARFPSVPQRTNHHRHGSRLRQGSEWDAGRGR